MTIATLSDALRRFLGLEASGGIVLAAAAALALILANSPAGPHYQAFVELPVGGHPLVMWINDGLMAVFFLLVGIEIKREVMTGELSNWGQAALPAIAALGGMIAPALVYAAINRNDPAALAGWAVPTATDIAFALGVLSLLGSRVPPSLKVFLLALAVIDDLGAIVVIALFYTSELSGTALALAALAIAGLAAMNRLGVRRLTPYLAVGLALWACVLQSGVHATLAGVTLGLLIPLDDGRLEHRLHPWVAYAILPLFAFANAGLALGGLHLSALADPVPLGVAAGLLVGKQVGVMTFAAAAIRTGLARLPEGATWAQFYGVAVLTGIGFTMSLFVGMLAFPDGGAHGAGVRLGVLAGSLASALLGAAILRAAAGRSQH
ncbi:MAG: Na+/H+ antiporter NhaA [Solirubrobacterales bacterium]